MSTALLYHGWGIHHCKYLNTSYKQGTVKFKIAVTDRLVCCPICKSRNLRHKGKVKRTLKTLPIGSKAVFIELDVPRIHCLDCQVIRQVKLPFSIKHSRMTRAFERYVIELSRMMTIKDISKLLQTSWDTIKNIIKHRLKKKYDKPKLGKLKHIAIDEIHLGKKQGYMTLVLDLKSGAIVYTALGKKGEVLNPFWKRLKLARANILAVATDMGQAYIKAVQENLPKATLAFDHFHIIKLFNENSPSYAGTYILKLKALNKRKYSKEPDGCC